MKIMKMSKDALKAKYGKVFMSKVIDARLTLKKKGVAINPVRKKATQVGMAGKIKKAPRESGEPSKKDMMKESNRFNPFRKSREKR